MTKSKAENSNIGLEYPTATRLNFHIEAMVEIDTDHLDDLEAVLDYIRQYGTARIVNAEVPKKKSSKVSRSRKSAPKKKPSSDKRKTRSGL